MSEKKEISLKYKETINALNGYTFTVSVKQLADLTSCFKKEKIPKEISQEDFNKSFDKKTEKFTVEEDDNEWTKLIKGLANIDWHEDPTTTTDK